MLTSCGSCEVLLPWSRSGLRGVHERGRKSSCRAPRRRRWQPTSSQQVAAMSVCGSAPQRHRAKHHCCHQQPRRELRQQHGSHGAVKNPFTASSPWRRWRPPRWPPRSTPTSSRKSEHDRTERNRRAPPPPRPLEPLPRPRRAGGIGLMTPEKPTPTDGETSSASSFQGSEIAFSDLRSWEIAGG